MATELDLKAFNSGLEGSIKKLSILEKSIGKINNAKILLSNKFNALKKPLDETKTSISKITTSIGKMKDVGVGINKLSESLGLKLDLELFSPLEASSKLEEGFESLKSTLKPTNEEFKRLEESVLSLSVKTATSLNDVVGLQNELAKAGMKSNDIIKSSKEILNLSLASGADAKETSKIGLDIMSSFKMSANNMPQISEILAKAKDTFKTTLPMLTQGIKLAAPIAQSKGLKLSQVSAMIGMLIKAGYEGINGGQALNKAIESLAKPNENALNTLSLLDVKTKDSNGSIRDFIEILGELNEKTKGMQDNKKLTTYKNIFGDKNAGAITKLASNANLNDNTILTNVQQLDNSSGSAGNMAQDKLNSNAGSLRKLTTSITTSITTSFVQMLKDITPVIKGVSSLFNAFKELRNIITSFKELRQTLQQLANTKTLLAIKTKALAFVTRASIMAQRAWNWAINLGRAGLLRLSNAQTLVTIKTKILTIATKAWAFAQRILNIAMKANPILLIISLIAMLVTAIIPLITSWDKVKNAFTGAFEWIIGVWNYVLSLFDSFSGWLEEKLGPVGSFLIKMFSPIFLAIEGVKLLIGLFTSAASWLGSLFGGDDEKAEKKKSAAIKKNKAKKDNLDIDDDDMMPSVTARKASFSISKPNMQPAITKAQIAPAQRASTNTYNYNFTGDIVVKTTASKDPKVLAAQIKQAVLIAIRQIKEDKQNRSFAYS